ncbi:MAG: undecaprenyl/decaprenyl-phosphate alpha-N-acetylglucosaminyl 1-phosphate transferase [Bernardetiaceae bacterium]|nr:undecaprenyl/decaprenyl-phosphate alpha-N-acetylglucosaminyl 1-phosphate transferase [Bernardetiaceae bacterium]
MKEIIFSLLGAFAISSFLMPQIIKIAHARGMHDAPDARKIHTDKIPTFGGIGIFFGFMIAALIGSFPYFDAQTQFLFGGILVIVVVGMRDDFMPLSAFWKLLGQIGAAILLVAADLRFHSLHGLFGVEEITIWWSYPISFFTIIVITNAFNLIDGIDGLAGTVSVIVFSFFGTWFGLLGMHVPTVICFATVGAVIAFLRFNYSPARIFMGDTGSLLLGFTASAIVLLFFDTNAKLPASQPLRFDYPIVIASAVMVYPLFDTIRVFVMRASRGRSPLSADKNHIHHLLLCTGLSHTRSVFVIAVFNLLYIGFFVFLNQFPVFSDNFLVPVLIVSAILLISILKKRIATL